MRIFPVDGYGIISLTGDNLPVLKSYEPRYD